MRPIDYFDRGATLAPVARPGCSVASLWWTGSMSGRGGTGGSEPVPDCGAGARGRAARWAQYDGAGWRPLLAVRCLWTYCAVASSAWVRVLS